MLPLFNTYSLRSPNYNTLLLAYSSRWPLSSLLELSKRHCMFLGLRLRSLISLEASVMSWCSGNYVWRSIVILVVYTIKMTRLGLQLVCWLKKLKLGGWIGRRLLLVTCRTWLCRICSTSWMINLVIWIVRGDCNTNLISCNNVEVYRLMQMHIGILECSLVILW